MGLAEIGRLHGQVFDDQAGRENAARFHVFVIHPVVADMRVGQGDDLLAITGIGQDFLVTGHGGVENHFTDGVARSAYGMTGEYSAVCECQDGGRGGTLKRQKHGDLRLRYGGPQGALRITSGRSTELEN